MAQNIERIPCMERAYIEQDAERIDRNVSNKVCRSPKLKLEHKIRCLILTLIGPPQ